jgi:hypothetical protein
MKYQLFFTCVLTFSLCYSAAAPADDPRGLYSKEVIRWQPSKFKNEEEWKFLSAGKVRVALSGKGERFKQDVSGDFVPLDLNWDKCRGGIVGAPISTVKEFDDPAIKGVSLRNNGLTNLSPKTFDRLRITHLNLSGNRLKNLPPGIFKGVPLQCLSLCGNEFDTVPSVALEGLHSLTHLYLSDNQIGYLLAEGFVDLSSLKLLSLSGNRLKKISSQALEGLGALVTLNVASNQLSKVDKSDFSRVRRLKHLMLNHNDIKTVSPDTRKWFKSLSLFGQLSYQLSEKLELYDESDDASLG